MGRASGGRWRRGRKSRPRPKAEPRIRDHRRTATPRVTRRSSGNAGGVKLNDGRGGGVDGSNEGGEGKRKRARQWKRWTQELTNGTGRARQTLMHRGTPINSHASHARAKPQMLEPS
eukprot:6197835-Pleurochrysis_carterae.AAC.2